MSNLYADETKARGYVMVVASVEQGQLRVARQTMNTLLMPGQRRLHFVKEKDPRRRKIASTLNAMGVQAVIYDASAITDHAKAREAILEAIVDDAAMNGDRVLVLEQDDSLVANDRKLIYQRVRKLGIEGELSYEHKRPHEEPLLWIPDAVAWCWAKKGEWRPRVDSMVARVQTLKSS